MTITIENFLLKSSQYGGFNLIELKKSHKEDNTDDIRETVVGYNITLEMCIKKIIEINQHRNKNTLNLTQYLVDLQNERRKIEKLLDLEILKKNK